MNDDISNKRAMFGSVKKVSTDYADLVAAHGGLAKHFAAFIKEVAALDMLAQKQATAAQGATAQKNADKLGLIDAAQDIQGALASYAEEIKDATLAAKMERTRSWMKTTRALTLADHVDSVVTEAETHKVALVAAGTKEAAITKLKTLAAAWRITAVAPRNATVVRSGATKGIDDQTETIMSRLTKNIDKLMESQKVDQPEFYTDYKRARIIIERGGSGPDTPETPDPEPPTTPKP